MFTADNVWEWWITKARLFDRHHILFSSGYYVLFLGIVFASKSLHKGTSPVCFIFYRFDWIFIDAVTNSQIIPKPLYLDNPPPKSSLLPIQPFKRHVHVPNQSREKHVSGHSGTAEGESNSDSIRLVLKGKLSEVWLSFKIECYFSSLNAIHFV